MKSINLSIVEYIEAIGTYLHYFVQQYHHTKKSKILYLGNVQIEKHSEI
jgi:hypothetical protein